MQIRNFIPAIHKEGYLFIAAFAIVTALIALISDTLGVIGLIATIWCVFFFRDPIRVTPIDENFVISPADGLVSKITLAAPPEELEMGSELMTRISVFLSVFDVHVNRIPAHGTITKLHYRPGKFLNASLDKASEDNERQSVAMVTKHNQPLAFVQIAGLIARRIVCDLKENQVVNSGERFGIIRFGSRMDVYLPQGVNPLVIEGQRVIGGETILANLASGEETRQGKVR